MNDVIKTEKDIKFIKDTFEKLLAEKLDLVRVSAPIMVKQDSGLNDHLNGTERRVEFDCSGINVEIVQSLAKWKRMALKKYNFGMHKGLYTDMNAIRRDETMDNIHSVYVDQWDWEKIIEKKDRSLDYLFKTVKDIYEVVKKVGQLVTARCKYKYKLPDEITCISTSMLETMYPKLSRKEREKAICKEYGAVFLYQIGWPLKDNMPHDSRAADYDDWDLNGDILLYYETLDIAFEISSMGIRVNEITLIKQLEYKNEQYKKDNPYCKSVIKKELPYTIGGGIGQSRLCMFFLKKKHIGEVQASIWTDDIINEQRKDNVELL